VRSGGKKIEERISVGGRGGLRGQWFGRFGRWLGRGCLDPVP
jgi:hypothetical protein